MVEDPEIISWSTQIEHGVSSGLGRFIISWAQARYNSDTILHF